MYGIPLDTNLKQKDTLQKPRKEKIQGEEKNL